LAIAGLFRHCPATATGVDEAFINSAIAVVIMAITNFCLGFDGPFAVGPGTCLAAHVANATATVA